MSRPRTSVVAVSRSGVPVIHNSTLPGSSERSWIETSRMALFIASQDQHGVAVAVKAIPLGRGDGVGPADEIDSRKRAHQHEERRTRQVEVRNKRVYHTEIIGWIDEK